MIEKALDAQSPVYESYNNGIAWEEVDKLPSAFIWNLALNKKGNMFFAATRNGLYTFSYQD